MTDKEIQDTIKELSDKEQKELEQAIKQLNSQVNTKPQVNNSKTLKNSSNNARPTSNNISSEKLKIEIDHFGLKNRLENSLEIKIFRIIKHATHVSNIRNIPGV